MKRLLAPLAAAALLLAGCSDTEQFRVNGTIEGKPTMNLRVGYYGDGAYRTIVTAPREGEFEFFGSSEMPAMVDIMDYDYRPLVRLYARNGETYEISMKRDDPYSATVTGNATSEEWSRFLRENADSLRAGYRTANPLIARYIAAHPDNVCSTLLLLTAYDSSHNPAEADSLLGLISPQARPSSLADGYAASLQRLMAAIDSAEVLDIPYYLRRGKYGHLKPSESDYTFLALSDRASRPEALPDALRKLAKQQRRVAIADLSLDTDTMDWRNSVRPDSATWLQGWAAGSISSIGIDRLAVPSLPYYIVCDSTGRQLYRGALLNRALSVADSVALK